jgi:hypothetical protein
LLYQAKKVAYVVPLAQDLAMARSDDAKAPSSAMQIGHESVDAEVAAASHSQQNPEEGEKALRRDPVA